MTTTADKTATPYTPPQGPVSDVRRTVRRLWRRLISMRTALVLLFLLAVAAVPGSLLPQRPLNPTKVQQYLNTHGAWGRLLDRLGFFDVFGSAWFAAIYLLLAVSLIGCLIPRIRLHWRALRARPLPAPRNLDRLPESGAFTVDAPPDEAAAELRHRLGRRWRTQLRHESDGVVTVSAEKGYSRETGNLLFHVALLFALFAIAIGRLWGYQGSVVLLEGSAFCNQVQQYDSWRPGRLAQDGRVAPFCIDRLDKFTATYLPTGEPKQFVADVTYSRGAAGAAEHKRITVNHPLRLEGDRVYLIGHGFAPTVTVRMPDGTTVTNTVAFIPQDANTFFSEGAFQFTGRAEPDGSHAQDIGLSGFFAPTPVTQLDGSIASAGPQAKNPVLGLFVYEGDVGNNGVPHSVYSLDPDLISAHKLNQIGQADLKMGQTLKLKNGVQVTFDGWKQWVSLQVSHDPTQGYLLIAAVCMVVGLICSLGVRRRRVWFRLVPGDRTPGGEGTAGSLTLVSVGGLARSDSGNFTDEFARLTERLAGEERLGDEREHGARPSVGHPVHHRHRGLCRGRLRLRRRVRVRPARAHRRDDACRGTVGGEVACRRGGSQYRGRAFRRRRRGGHLLDASDRAVRAPRPGCPGRAHRGPPDARRVRRPRGLGDRAGHRGGPVAVGQHVRVLRGGRPGGRRCVAGDALENAATALPRHVRHDPGDRGHVPGRDRAVRESPAARARAPVVLAGHSRLGRGHRRGHAPHVSGAEHPVPHPTPVRGGRAERAADPVPGHVRCRLPAAQSLDKSAYRIVAFAFPIYTFGIICGAIWAEAAWGRYWGWDPKETWAFITWVIYAAYLHARATAGWRGRAAAWINVAGFGAMTFNFFVVNIVISGLHSYAGLN